MPSSYPTARRMSACNREIRQPDARGKGSVSADVSGLGPDGKYDWHAALVGLSNEQVSLQRCSVAAIPSGLHCVHCSCNALHAMRATLQRKQLVGRAVLVAALALPGQQAAFLPLSPSSAD